MVCQCWHIPSPTKIYPKTIHVQRLIVNGCRNEKTPGFFFSGFLIIMLIPKFMNGLEKSTTYSLSLVIDSGATAKSAS